MPGMQALPRRTPTSPQNPPSTQAGRPEPKHHQKGHSLRSLKVMSSKLHQRQPHWETESMGRILTHEVTAAHQGKTLKGINSHVSTETVTSLSSDIGRRTFHPKPPTLPQHTMENQATPLLTNLSKERLTQRQQSQLQTPP